MDILNVPFEEYIIVKLGEEIVKIIAFKTPEHGNVKFGVEASRSIKVHREEIYQAIKEKEKLLDRC